jgi:uncharacterized protein YkwD
MAPTSERAEEMLREINAVRTSPQLYAEHVSAMLAMLNGKMLKRPGKAPLMTQEGAIAVQEAATFLKSAEPLPPLTSVSAGMCKAASDHAADLCATGSTDHDGSDGSSPFDRLSRHGRWTGAAAENLAFGGSAVRDIVVMLLVDDGVPTRCHRKNIFGDDFRLLGFAEGSHPRFGSVQVQVFASAFTEGGGGGAAAKPANSNRQAHAAGPAIPAPSVARPAATKPAAKPTASAPAERLQPPPGGRVDVQTSTVRSGGRKSITKTTTVTYADGSSSTTTETRDEPL